MPVTSGIRELPRAARRVAAKSMTRIRRETGSDRWPPLVRTGLLVGICCGFWAAVIWKMTR